MTVLAPRFPSWFVPSSRALALLALVAALAVAAVPAAPVVAAPAEDATGDAPEAAGEADEAGAELAATSCVGCHSDPDWVGEEGVEVVDGLRHDAHAEAGLSCHDCHGGDPSTEVAEDMTAAMDPDHAANPYRGVPERGAVPEFCGRCHSDPSYMRRFQPDARVDQEREYRTSQHGLLLAEGDPKVATCVDCHGTHGIRPAEDPEARIHPRNVAETCRGCHGDPDYMQGYELEDGRPIPVDQYARWRRSVHAAAMFEKEDLSAPTCNDCHGNHGALPPGLESIAFVCGQCHGREAELFRNGAKQAGFRTHNEYLSSVGEGGCTACHGEPKLAEALAPLRTFSECSTCHGNHGIVRPTVAMLSPLPEVPCAFCHGTGVVTDGPTIAEPQEIREHYEGVRDELLARAQEQGLEGEARFDWMVDRALDLPQHTTTAGEGGEPLLRAEFERLFDKFRIGRTYYTYESPRSGETVRAPVVRCAGCHSAEPGLAGEPVGLDTARALLEQQQEVTALTARAERMLLAARRGGVEVGEASTAVDRAVDAQIELEVLVHTFSADEDGAFHEKYREGLESARAALESAREALDELAFRRRGLAVSLVLILLVLVGLGLKIRQLSRGPR